MAEMKLIQNGIRKASNGKRKRRKRNPSTIAKATKSVRRRNGTTKAGAMSFLKKNGLKAVSKTASNGKRKRKRTRRNGIKAIRTRSNGLFGDTSAMIKKTLTLTGGAVATNVVGNWAASFLSPYLASFGLGAYTNLVTQFLVAMFGVPELAKLVKQDKDMARLGGMLSVTLTALNHFFPQFNSLNPFGGSAIVVNPNGQVALTGAAVKQVAAAAAQDTAAKIAGFANQMEAMNTGSGFINNDYIGNPSFS